MKLYELLQLTAQGHFLCYSFMGEIIIESVRKKMIVGICNSDKMVRDYTKRECKKVFFSQEVESKIYTFSNGVELLKKVKKTEFDMVILDIDMPGINGIEIKNILQAMEYKTVILFVTSQMNKIREAFGLYVMGVVNKENIKEELPSALLMATDILEKHVNIAGIDSRTIVYIEAERVYSIFYLKSGKQIYVRKSLKDLEAILSCVGILRIHRSYMVNLRWIKKIEKEKVYLEWYVSQKNVEKKILPIAQRRREAVERRIGLIST